MNNVLKAVLVIVVALAAYYGLDYMRNKATKQHVAEKIESLRAEAEKQHPGMAKTDALKAVAEVDSKRQLDALSSVEEKKKSAAFMFFGFYFLNTEGRVDYCKARGTDLTPFVNAFTAKNRAEYAEARKALSKTGMQPESLLSTLKEQIASVVEQDMKDVATGANVPVEQTCALFNEHADMLVQEIKLTPEIRSALMAN